MDGDDGDLELPYYCTIKVHRVMCLELKKFIDKILRIFPAIELSRPRSSRLQAVCSLHVALDKAKLLIQHCSESSKFYLAITGDKILLRCEKIRNNMELCLSQIQDTVPSLLAAKIYGIIDDLRATEFCLESSENEAGVVVLALLRDLSASNSAKTFDVSAFKLAALRLNITSPLALLIEKRSMKRLLEKVSESERAKKKILECLFYVLRKYGDSILSCPVEGKESSSHSIEPEPNSESKKDMARSHDSSLPEAPEEFKCPISGRLFYDPVVIATGKTFERVWIEKWFSKGHEICPITRVKLEHLSLVPNTSIQSLILKWCSDHGIALPDPALPHPKAPTRHSSKSFSSTSVVSFGSSVNDLNLPAVSSLSICNSNASWGSDSLDENSRGGFKSLAVLSQLASLPWESQCKAIKDMKDKLKENFELCHVTLSGSSIKSLIRFTKDAHDSRDVEAQRDGAEVLSVILKENRCEMALLDGEAVSMLASFLDSDIIDKALEIVESLSNQERYKAQIVASGALPSIIKVLHTPVRKYQTIAFKTLTNLSSNADIGHHSVYLGCISKLVPFLGDHVLAGHCIMMIKNLCNTGEARTAVADAKLCVSSMAKLLEHGNEEEREDTLEVLLSLCHEHGEYCELIMSETIVQSIVDIAVNGKSQVKAIARELLQVLGCVVQCGGSESSAANAGSSTDGPSNNGKRSEEKKVPYCKRFGFFLRGRKKSAFSKTRQVLENVC